MKQMVAFMQSYMQYPYYQANPVGNLGLFMLQQNLSQPVQSPPLEATILSAT